MKDEILKKFMKDLLGIKIEKEKFSKEIEIFSKFLSYMNPNYNYNGTYLDQFVNDFCQFIEKLRKREEKYYEILKALKEIKKEYELTIDGMAYIKITLKDEKQDFDFIGINKKFLEEKGIEIKIKYKKAENEYIFCKVYPEWKNGDEKTVKIICKEVDQYIKTKEKQEKNSGIKEVHITR